MLIATSVVGLTFIVERGLALRWKKVLGPTLDPSSPGSFVTIAPSGHLAITAAANSTFYLLGP